MKPAIHEEIRGGAQHQTSPRADQQTFTLVNPHGHLPRWPRSLLTERTSGLWEQEIHRQGMFPMTVTHLEPDPPPSDMRWTAQGRPSTHPHVKSAHRTRQGAMPGSVPYATTTREIKMITVEWDSSFSAHTMVPPWGNGGHNNIFVLMCKDTAIQARAKPKTFYFANRGYFYLT